MKFSRAFFFAPLPTANDFAAGKRLLFSKLAAVQILSGYGPLNPPLENERFRKPAGYWRADEFFGLTNPGFGIAAPGSSPHRAERSTPEVKSPDKQSRKFLHALS